MKANNILLAALGTTPQIITESLYQLMVIKKTPIHEIHLITTTTGQNKAEELLFRNGKGPFFEFCEAYGFSATKIPPKYHLIENRQGEELSDIRTPDDNQAAADFFLKIVRQLTSRDDTHIFATIAGGRKTMSAYLYLTMQLMGRDQDALYHVLVHPESIESNTAFYYPHKDVEEMEFPTRNDGSFKVLVSEIRIDMAEIPFVKMRRILPKDLVDSVSHFSELVDLTQAELDKAQFEPELEVNLPQKTLVVTDRDKTYQIKLRPTQMCFYAYLSNHGSLLNHKAGNQSAMNEMWKQYRAAYAIAGTNQASFIYERLMQMRSKINAEIRKSLPQPLLQEYLLIHSDQKYGGATFSLHLPLSKIRIITSES